MFQAFSLGDRSVALLVSRGSYWKLAGRGDAFVLAFGDHVDSRPPPFLYLHNLSYLDDIYTSEAKGLLQSSLEQRPRQDGFVFLQPEGLIQIFWMMKVGSG